MSEAIECTKPSAIDAGDVSKRRAAGAGRTRGSRAYRVSAGINVEI
jgi:hypothetical protein